MTATYETVRQKLLDQLDILNRDVAYVHHVPIAQTLLLLEQAAREKAEAEISWKRYWDSKNTP